MKCGVGNSALVPIAGRFSSVTVTNALLPLILSASKNADRHRSRPSVHEVHIFRVGPNDVVTDDPEIIWRINAVRSPYKRLIWYDATSFDHSRDHVFCGRDLN